MKSWDEQGLAAFPVTQANDAHGNISQYAECGMSLRDWFAGQAILNHPFNLHEVKEIANYAYIVADAMLEERKK